MLVLYLMSWAFLGYLLADFSQAAGIAVVMGSGVCVGILTSLPSLVASAPRAVERAVVPVLPRRRAVTTLLAASILTLLLTRYLYAYQGLSDIYEVTVLGLPPGSSHRLPIIELISIPLLLGFISSSLLLAIFRLLHRGEEITPARIARFPLYLGSWHLEFVGIFLAVSCGLVFLASIDPYTPTLFVALFVLPLYMTLRPVFDFWLALARHRMRPGDRHSVTCFLLLFLNLCLALLASLEFTRASYMSSTAAYTFLAALLASFLLGPAAVMLLIWKPALQNRRLVTFQLFVLGLDGLMLPLWDCLAYHQTMPLEPFWPLKRLLVPEIYEGGLVVLNGLALFRLAAPRLARMQARGQV